MGPGGAVRGAGLDHGRLGRGSRRQQRQPARVDRHADRRRRCRHHRYPTRHRRDLGEPAAPPPTRWSASRCAGSPAAPCWRFSVGLAGWLIPQVLLGEGLPTAWIGLAGLPFVFGLGVALLRFRLFDLDVILNRGLVYGLLTVSVVTVYLVIVTAVSGVMRGSSTTPAAVVATAVIAVAINPLRMLLQRGVDRMMYGDRRDPYSALSRLGRRLDDAGDGDQLLPAVAEDIADALRVPLREDRARAIWPTG